ncbi:MAG: AAA family ATPase [Candidatus Muirbacterium halophilum]|nr:AAA family ATPase [Candidatus Muirbacterium halophilum]MCK9475991.1 AAA family ATPase [Candidatus Muirbacterium halophilum]
MKFNKKIFINILFFLVLSIFCFSQDIISFENEITQLNIKKLETEAKIESISDKIKKMEREILYSREVVPSPLINEYKSEVLKLETELKKELLTYREKHPVIKKIQTQIEMYENKLKEEIEKTSEKKIYSQNPEYMELISNLNKFETENAGIKVRIEEISKIIKEETKKLEYIAKTEKENNIKNSTMENTIEVKSDINALNKMFLIILLILLFGILYYFVFIFKKNKIKSKEQTEQPNFLGNIGFIDFKNSESGISKEAVLINDPDNDLKKSIRIIAEKIALRTKTFAVTSLEKSVGKTFLSVNLAAYWANKGNKVLIIDSNFKQPKLHRMFLKENDTGLADLLLGNKADIIKNTITNIDIISAGHSPVGSDEMLESIQFLDTIKNLENDYSFIIIDMGNVKDNTEPFILGKYIPLIGVLEKEKQIDSFEKICEVHSNVMAGAVVIKTVK